MDCETDVKCQSKWNEKKLQRRRKWMGRSHTNLKPENGQNDCFCDEFEFFLFHSNYNDNNNNSHAMHLPITIEYHTKETQQW